MSVLTTTQMLVIDGQRKLLRDFRQLYRVLSLTPLYRSDKCIVSLMCPYMGVRITTMCNKLGIITKKNTHRVWNSIRTDIPVLYEDSQKVIDIAEELGYHKTIDLDDLPNKMNRYSYDIRQSYVCLESNKNLRFTMLYLYDFGLRPFSYPFKAENDMCNPLLTKMDYAPMKYIQFDSNGYLTPQGLEEEREKFVKEIQDEELVSHLDPKVLESEWWLNSNNKEELKQYREKDESQEVAPHISQEQGIPNSTTHPLVVG